MKRGRRTRWRLKVGKQATEDAEDKWGAGGWGVYLGHGGRDRRKEGKSVYYVEDMSGFFLVVMRCPNFQKSKVKAGSSAESPSLRPATNPFFHQFDASKLVRVEYWRLWLYLYTLAHCNRSALLILGTELAAHYLPEVLHIFGCFLDLCLRAFIRTPTVLHSADHLGAYLAVVPVLMQTILHIFPMQT